MSEQNMTDTNKKSVNSTGAIAWMIKNNKAANLLMLVLIFGGLYVTSAIQKEVFPEFEVDEVKVTVSYSGASPEEVEQGIVLALEESISDVEGLDEIESTASEGSASISAELLDDADPMQVFQEVQQAVSGITTLPDEAETPVVSMSSRKRQVLAMTISGNISDWELREKAEIARDQLLSSKDISQVEVRGGRSYEVHIDVEPLMLERLGMSLEDVATAVSNASVERSGGSIKTEGGEILLRVSNRAQWAADFESLPIIQQANGESLTLADIAQVKDEFEDTVKSHLYNGNNALSIDVYRVGNQTPIGVSDAVEDLLPSIQQSLPDGVNITILQDMSEVYEARLNLLLKNAFIGLILVMFLLTLFLDVRLAFWVTMGIPTAFLGGMLFLPIMDVSINMVSMFAFILALGIVVDDAIIAGENIYQYRQEGYGNIEASIKGMQSVIVPLTFSILSNIVAFIPLFFLPGMIGKIFSTVPLVVVSVFIVSWIEAAFILPAHLAHIKSTPNKSGFFGVFSRVQQVFSSALNHFLDNHYQPVLLWCLRWRYVTFLLALSCFILVFGFVASGRTGFSLMPRVESDRAGISVTLPVGSSMSRMQAMEAKILDSVDSLSETLDRETNILGVESTIDNNSLSVVVHLTDEDTRTISTSGFVGQWRQELGDLIGVESVLFESDIGGPGRGKALTVELSHRDEVVLQKAGEALADILSEYSMVSDISDGFTEGKQQFDFILLPRGENLGLTLDDISRQVRAAFYGSEASRQQRGRHEIKVLVRLADGNRDSEYDINQLKIQTPAGDFVPLYEVAKIDRGRAYTDISRQDGKRVIRVDANVTPIDQTSTVIAGLNDGVLQQLEIDYPGLSVRFRGKEADIQDSTSSLLFSASLAGFILYAMLVIPFNSYSQPILVLVAIPFGVIGAIIGHVVMGFGLSIISILGIVALSGVVVNDSLVMIDYANEKRRSGLGAYEAIKLAGMRRLRPILLTTVTTFGGLAPMIFETSTQAKFLIPMAISLGYGILFATLICLLLVPALYLILEDVHMLFTGKHRQLKHKLG